MNNKEEVTQIRIYCGNPTNCSEKYKKTCCQQCKFITDCKRVCHNKPAICGWEKARNIVLASRHYVRGNKQ